MSELSRKTLLNLPNILTYWRILVIPIIVLFMMMQGPNRDLESNRLYAWIAAGLFILAAISDVIDGHYARKYGMTSLMGKFFDPMADKLVHMAVMVMLIPMERIHPILVVVILFREIFITGLRAIAIGEGVVIDAENLGKAKTICFNVGLAGMLIYYDFFGVHLYDAGYVVVLIGALLALVSGFQYVGKFFWEIARRS